MGTCDRRGRGNACRPAALCIGTIALVHLLAKNLAAALLSVSLCGSPTGGATLVDQFLLDRLSAPTFSPFKVRDVPESLADFTLQ
jgi:hypothetical protein